MHPVGVLVLLFVNFEIKRDSDTKYKSVYIDWKSTNRRHQVARIVDTATSPIGVQSTKEKPSPAWANLIGVEQESRQLINHIRGQLQSPTPSHSRLNNSKLNDAYTILKSTKLFNKTNGFFIEVEAKDGISNSLSVPWESQLNWIGLLIEANTSYYNQLINSGRRVFTLNGCLCRTEFTERMYFHSGPYYAPPKADSLSDSVEMLCYPIYSVVAALNIVRTIDLLFLNVAGWELDVLQTIPFGQLDVGVIVAEYSSLESFQHLQSFMESHDYYTFCRTKHEGIFTKQNLAWDKTANETGHPQDLCLYAFKFLTF